MSRFLKYILFFFSVIYIPSIYIVFFSSKNILTDYSAQKIIDNSFGKLVLSQNNKFKIADERRVVENLIYKLPNRHFNYLIVGSSRTMQLGINTGLKNSINLGVSGMELDEFYAICELVKEKNITFDTFVFEFCPWFFKTKSTSPLVNKFNFKDRFVSTFRDILFFQWNWSDFRSANHVFRNYFLELEDDCNVIGSKNPVGRFQDWSIEQPELSEFERNMKINELNSYFYKLNDFHHIDYNKFRYFMNFVVKYKSSKPSITFISPFYYSVFQNKKHQKPLSNIKKLEQMIIRINKIENYNNSIKGSFDPVSIGIDSNCFVDGLHINENCVKQIFWN